MHCDTDPGAQLGEAVQATLFTHHPYGVPIIGWGHEIEGLKREDALAYYQRFYTPENAILVVAGDADPEETLKLAEATYGKVRRAARGPSASARGAADGRRPARHGARREGAAAELAAPLSRPLLPHRGARRIGSARRARPPARRRADEPALSRAGDGGEARRLGLGLLPRHGARPEPVHRQRHARAGRVRSRRSTRPSTGCWRSSSPKASTRARSSGPRPASSPTRSTPATASPTSPAGTAPRSRSARRSREVEDWPAKIEAVDAEAVLDAARKWLDHKPAVTGHLLPLDAEAA